MDGRFWGWLFPSFSIFYDFRAAVHKSGNRCTLTHSILLGFSLYAKRGQEGLCGTFSWMVGTGKGGGRTWPGALVFWREGVSIHHGSHDERQASQHFPFLSGHWVDQHQDKAHRLHHTHTHDLNDDDDFLCQQHHRSGIAHTHTLYRHTHASAAVMAARGTGGAAGGQVLVERNITPTLLEPTLSLSTVPFAAASTSPAFQPGESTLIAPQRRMTMMNEGNKMGVPGLYDECIWWRRRSSSRQAERQT